MFFSRQEGDIFYSYNANSINQSYAREIQYDGPDDLYYTYYPQIYYKSTSLNCYIGVFDFLWNAYTCIDQQLQMH